MMALETIGMAAGLVVLVGLGMAAVVVYDWIRRIPK